MDMKKEPISISISRAVLEATDTVAAIHRRSRSDFIQLLLEQNQEIAAELIKKGE